MFYVPKNAVRHQHSRLSGLIDPINQLSLATGLTHYYNLEEASGSRADLVGGASLAATNTPGNAAGLLGNALSLVTASSQYLSHATFFTSGVDRSFSFWIKPTATGLSGQKGLISAGNSNVDNTPFLLMVLNQTTAKLSVYENGTGGYHIGSTTLVAGNWYHIVYTTATNVRVVYINGAVELNYTQTDNGTNTNVYIGSGFNATFDGLIDELAFWSRGLTAAEVTLLYNSGNGLVP